jgi:hypothetical protein
MSINAAAIRAMKAAGMSAGEIIDEYVKALDEATRDRAQFLKLRPSILRRDGMRCTYCGSDGNGTPLHCDHVLPKSRGGKSTPDNLVAACLSCNSRKRTRTPEEWRGE